MKYTNENVVVVVKAAHIASSYHIQVMPLLPLSVEGTDFGIHFLFA